MQYNSFKQNIYIYMPVTSQNENKEIMRIIGYLTKVGQKPKLKAAPLLSVLSMCDGVNARAKHLLQMFNVLLWPNR